ncbi:MAG: hypothetical protein V4722_20670 [Bacteroidota bacterium]
MVSIRYQILFTISLQHDYYAGSAFSDLVIVPSPETQVLLQDYKIICRMNDNVLTAMIQTEGGKPFISLNEGMVFRFFITVNNGSFINFSALKMFGVGGGIYYFSNKGGHKKNNCLYLSAPVALYKNTETYELGAVAKKASRIFECIKANSAADKHDTTDAASWRDIVTHQSNFLPAYADTQTYKTGDQVKVAAKVFEALKPSSAVDKHNTGEAAFWQEITDIAYVSNADLSDAISIGGEGIPPKTFAVIDLFNGGGEAADFALVKPTGEVQATAYYIRFKNRSTIWKYISQKKAVTAVSDANSVYSFSNAAVSNEFVSAAPIPLTRQPLSSIKMNATINARPVEVTGLENATATTVTPTSNSASYQLFSEIYLNY